MLEKRSFCIEYKEDWALHKQANEFFHSHNKAASVHSTYNIRTVICTLLPFAFAPV